MSSPPPIEVSKSAAAEAQHASGAPPERLMLAGTRPRLEELWRTVRIAAEFIRGFRQLHFVGPCVTVFGSARFPPGTPWYEMGRQLGAELGRGGFTVMTGGGPGVMEAANRGAREVGAPSLGCNIMLPMEQDPNPYCDRCIAFRCFFVRKVMLLKYSYGFVVLGRSYWSELDEFLRSQMIPDGTISPGDIDLFHVTDDPKEAADFVVEMSQRKFGLRRGVPPKPRWWLLER